jgi:hypothetical protein
MKKLVIQKDNFGCSIACVAQILDINYQQAKKLFPNNHKAGTAGFICREIILALKKANLNYYYHYIKPKYRNKIYKNKNLVFLKRSKKYPSGHYLARLNNQWFDPWINFNEDQNIKNAKAGLRKRLPEKPIYLISLFR